MRAIFALLACALPFVAACPAPMPPDATIVCHAGDNACPDGYQCEPSMRLCYRTGHLDGGHTCSEYCNCIGTFCAAAAGTFPSEGACLDACSALSIDALNCRAYHCALAGSDPGTHCPHSLGQNTCP